MRSKYFLIITGLVFTATAVLAGDENAALKKELSAPVVTVQPQMVQAVQQPAQQIPVQQVPAQQVYQQAPATSQPIYVIEKQPTTYVEDAPLKESKADQLRKSREDVERNTEERIVEKLEGDRVRAEQERAKKILDVMDPKPEAKPVAEAPIAPPQQVVVVPPPAVTQVKEDIKDIPKEEKKLNRVSMQALMGYSAYPSVQNVQSGTSFGAGVGYLLDSQLSLDLDFIYTRFNIDSTDGSYTVDPNTGILYPRVTRMDQYNIAGDVKYRLLQDSKLSPYVGGIVSYTMRNFGNGNVQYSNQVNNNSLSSWALDAGGIAGVDLALSEKFRIGMDLRYLFNITYNLNNVPNRSYYFSTSNPNTSAVESLSYYTFAVNAQLMF